MKGLALLLLVLVPVAAYGHGSASETVGPVEINGRDASLEISSSASDPDLAEDQQISISLIDDSTQVTLRDVTFAVRAERGEAFLFEQEFLAEHGFIVFNFASESGPITITEEDGSGFFASLLGFESRLVRVAGDDLASGGLYKFQVMVTAAEGVVVEPPAEFAAGVSVPQTVRHYIDDPNYGAQHVDIITYYDTVTSIMYDPHARELSYFMPFEWSADNINQTLVVHEEISIPQEYGDLLASGFEMRVNGIRISDEAVNIDDFAPESRTVHFTIFQQELLRLLEETDSDGMSFEISPDRDYIHQSAVTENGQFRVYAHAPGGLASGGMARISFDITDVFLRDAPVEERYDLAIVHDGRRIHEQSGTSSGAGNTAEFAMPADITGIIHAEFENIGDNAHASAIIPMVVDRAPPIPGSLRDAALAWSQGAGDSVFLEEVRQLVPGAKHAPSWLKTAAGAWGNGVIGDGAFLDVIRYLQAPQ